MTMASNGSLTTLCHFWTHLEKQIQNITTLHKTIVSGTLYEIKTMKAGTKLLQQLFVASQAGRSLAELE